MTIDSPKVQKFLDDPESAAKAGNLVYITDRKLTISRHRHARGFYYTRNGKKITDKKSLDRIKKLVIPPAWESVRITHLKNGHIQVIGRDQEGRKQYRYHPEWSALMNATKFAKMAAFGNQLPGIRKQVEQDLKLPKMTKRKCLALVLALMEETHIRIGNDYYARRNNSYGLSTLRTRHVDIYKNRITFEFTGKKGKKHSITIRNKRFQKLIMQCEEIPGWELFKYYDEEGKHHSIDSGMVNDYVRELCGDYFSAKDFRTWGASKIFFETLYEIDSAETEEAREKQLPGVYDKVAEALGNTRAVCKSYYVHPGLPKSYVDDTIQKYFTIFAEDSSPGSYLSITESALLEFLKDYDLKLP